MSRELSLDELNTVTKGLPHTLQRCNVCGDYRGERTIRAYSGKRIEQIDCLCSGALCVKCKLEKVHRPISNYLDTDTLDCPHVPHFSPLICKKCWPLYLSDRAQQSKITPTAPVMVGSVSQGSQHQAKKDARIEAAAASKSGVGIEQSPINEKQLDWISAGVSLLLLGVGLASIANLNQAMKTHHGFINGRVVNVTDNSFVVSASGTLQQYKVEGPVPLGVGLSVTIQYHFARHWDRLFWQSDDLVIDSVTESRL